MHTCFKWLETCTITATDPRLSRERRSGAQTVPRLSTLHRLGITVETLQTLRVVYPATVTHGCHRAGDCPMTAAINYQSHPPPTAQIVIIGGGVVGAATAFYAARAG